MKVYAEVAINGLSSRVSFVVSYYGIFIQLLNFENYEIEIDLNYYETNQTKIISYISFTNIMSHKNESYLLWL